MKTRTNILLSVVALLAVFAAVRIGWRLNVSANASGVALREVSAENAALRARLRQQGGVTASRTPEQIAAADAARAEATKAADEKKRQDVMAQMMAKYERLDKDPEYQLKYYAAQRARMDADYGPFARIHNLSDAQQDAMFDAMLKKQLRYDKMPVDLYAQFPQALQLKPGDPMEADIIAQRKKLQAEADNEYNNAIQAAIGDEMAAELKRYERARPDWDGIANLSADMAVAGIDPISVEQASLLVDVISASKKNKQADWDAMDASAREILSGEQFEYFSTVYSSVQRATDELDAAIQKLNAANRKKAAAK